jgi:hypothetical protein
MFYFNEDGTQVDVEYYSIFHDEYFGSVNQLELALFNKKAAPAETTAPETTAAPVTTAPAPETTAVPETTAPETTAAVDTTPKEDRSSALWIVLGIAAAAAAAVGAVIAIRKKSSD